MPKYKVITPLEYNQKRVEPGKTLDLDDDTAAPLLAAGAVEAVQPKGQPAAEKTD